MIYLEIDGILYNKEEIIKPCDVCAKPMKVENTLKQFCTRCHNKRAKKAAKLRRDAKKG